jgi:outer membrane protein, heavy metal efflux system
MFFHTRWLAVLLAALCAGCQSWQRQPLEPELHVAHWRERSPSDAAAYADALAGRFHAPREPFNADDGLNLAEAEAVTLFFNPRLRVARLNAGVELATAEQAGRWQDPELHVEGGWIIAGIPNPWFIGVGVKFTVPLSGRPGVERDLAFARHSATLRDVVLQEWQLLAELRLRWRDLESASEAAALTDSYLAELAQLAGLAVRLRDAGEISRLDARLIEIEQASRRAELRLLRQRVTELEAEIRELLGLHPDAPLQLVADAPEAPTLPDDLHGVLQRCHAGLALRRAEYETAEQTLRLEVRKQYPDLSIGPGYELEAGQSRIALGFGLPIPIINLNREGIARARAAREAARAAFEAELESALHQLARAELRAANSEALHRQILDEVVPLADQQVADAAALAQAGEFDALRQLEVLARRHETRLQVLHATFDATRARDAVLMLLGPAFTEEDDE